MKAFHFVNNWSQSKTHLNKKLVHAQTFLDRSYAFYYRKFGIYEASMAEVSL